MSMYSMHNVPSHPQYCVQHNTGSTDTKICNQVVSNFLPIVEATCRPHVIGSGNTSIEHHLNMLIGTLNDAHKHVGREKELEDLHHCGGPESDTECV